ncbi:MAG: ABC transporter ATP-binding protein [Thermogutta sp.]
MNKAPAASPLRASASDDPYCTRQSADKAPSLTRPTIAPPHFHRGEHCDVTSEILSQPNLDDLPNGTSAKAAESLLSVRGLVKSYRKASVEIPVLKGVGVDVYPGEFLAIVGQSGSGKSTLLHLLGQLDQPDDGMILLRNQRIDNLPTYLRDRLRNQTFGMVFQFYHLLPELSTLENVLIPAMIGLPLWRYWRERAEHRRRATELLAMMGLGHRLKHRPHELSGGELQRAAIARALVNRPQILLADEPTGNLDPETGQEILDLLRTLRKQEGLTIVMVTHDHSIAALADRVLCLSGGQIRGDSMRLDPDKFAESASRQVASDVVS